MTNEKTPLDKLIEYAETAMADGYPYEVIGEDLALTVKALRALRVEPSGTTHIEIRGNTFFSGDSPEEAKENADSVNRTGDA